MARLRAKCARCGQQFEYEDLGAQLIACPNCQATLAVKPKPPGSAPQKADPLLGQKLGEFEITEVLGRGGMGAVYKARQVSLDRFVALKMIRTPDVDASFVSRFGREARAAAAVNHPNIIEIYAVGRQGEYQFIAMEYVGGGSLSSLVRQEGRVPPERALGLMKQTTAALAKAHAAGILHRDIKPQNILLTGDGLVKLADFGLAKRAEGDVAATIEGTVVGTMLYMAPEVAAGKPADVRADLYSLGATFYHVLAGQPPFQGTSVTQLALLHNQAPVPPLQESAPDAPPALCRVIHRLLRKEPGGRYQNAEELLKALDAVEKGLAAEDSATVEASALRGSALERREAKRQQRRKTALLVSVGGAAAVLLLVIGLMLAGGGKGGTADRAVLAATTGTPAAARTPVAPLSSTPRTAKVPTPGGVSTRSRVEAKPPAWEKDLKAAEEKAKAAVAAQRFGEAVKEYGALADRYGDVGLRLDVQQRIEAVRKEADAAYRKVEEQARQLAGQKAYARACDALGKAIEQFGTEDEVSRARTLLAEIKAAEEQEKRAASADSTKPPDAEAKAKAEAERRAAEEKSRQLEALRAKVFLPIEGMIKAWGYTEAAEALAALAAKEPSLADEARRRQAEVALLARLKAKMIAKIKSAEPKLEKRTLLLPGVNGQLSDADETRIAVTLPQGATGGHLWKDLSARSARLLAQRVVDPKDPDDLVASALLALVYDDGASAEKDFEAARALGAQVDRYLVPIAEAALAQAKALIDKQSFSNAKEALAAIEAKYGKTAWYAGRKQAVEAQLRRIESSTAENAAEKLYAQAAELFKAKDYFELKPVVEKLNSDFAETRVVTDAQRKPSVADMTQATEKLGKTVTVAKDGRGGFKSIQEAINAATPNSTVVIADSGLYTERLSIPEAKKGLTLKGKKGCWPILGTEPASKRAYRWLLDVEAPDCTIERVVFALTGSSDTSYGCINVKSRSSTNEGTGFTLRYCLLYTSGYSAQLVENYGGKTAIDHCILAKAGSLYGNLLVTNTISLGRYLYGYCSSSSMVPPRGGDPAGARDKAVRGVRFENCVLPRFETSSPCEIDHCTIAGTCELRGEPNVVTNSIIEQVNAEKADTQIDYCDIFGKTPFVEFAKPGKHCMTRPPLFANPSGFDFRVRPGSPCHGKGADGTDMGCRYTKDMVDMLQLAVELRKRGLIDFRPFSDRSD